MKCQATILMIWFLNDNLRTSEAAISYDECKEGDAIFKKSKTELIIHGPVEWEESFQVKILYILILYHRYL